MINPIQTHFLLSQTLENNEQLLCQAYLLCLPKQLHILWICVLAKYFMLMQIVKDEPTPYFLFLIILITQPCEIA